MRIAYFGPAPLATASGSVYIAYVLVRELVNQGHEDDVYTELDGRDSHPELLATPGVHWNGIATVWEWDRWYSRNRLTAMVTGQLALAHVQRDLVKRLVTEHRRNPYDVVYRCSQIELFSMRRWIKCLPPIVVHPGTCAAGEQYHHWLERKTAIRAEGGIAFGAAEVVLRAGRELQKRDIHYATRVVAGSQVFAECLVRDYGYEAARIRVVPNSIDLDRYPVISHAHSVNVRAHKRRLLYVGRIATRKGIEDLVTLSHRLRDLSERVELRIVGSHTLWSDYRWLLSNLNTHIAHYVGPKADRDLMNEYHSADWLVIPSHFEPFGLVGGEALACGLPVIASDAVGMAQYISSPYVRAYPDGNVDALEQVVREVVTTAPPNSTILRNGVSQVFGPSNVARLLARELDEGCRSAGARAPAM